MLGSISIYLSFLSGTVIKNYILWTNEQHRIVRFLFVRGLTTNFLVDGIVVEDNRMTSVKSRSDICDYFLCFWAKY
jgi:hypothetical protein